MRKAIYVANTMVMQRFTGQEVGIKHRTKRGGFYGCLAEFPDGFVRFVYDEEVAPKKWRGHRVRVLDAQWGMVRVRFANGKETHVKRKELT